MTKEEKQRGLELQAYIDSVKDMTLKEIAIQHLKKYHLPKFLSGLLVKFSYPLLLAKDYKLDKLEKECTDLRNNCENFKTIAEPEIIALKEENAGLKELVEQKQHLADVRLEQSLENYKLFSDERKARIDVDIALDSTTDQLTYAKTIIQDLLDNTDEYARQRAEDFLKECE